MRDELRQTRTYLMRLFQSHGKHPRHDLGQNFLIDLNIIDVILAAAELTPDDVVLEVGPGTGGMTTFLARDAGDVVSVELDPFMHQLAGEATAGITNLTLLNVDALRTKNALSEELLAAVRERLAVDPARRLKLVANLPYAVATPVITNLVASDLPWSRMVVTVQYELALRMRDRPGGDHYGALAVWLQAQGRVKLLKKLSPKVFWPRPDVNSAVVRIEYDPRRAARIVDRGFFHDFIRRLFQQRRKSLRSVLGSMYRRELGKPRIGELLRELQLAESARAEDLDVPTLIGLSNALRTAMAPGS